eukprot:gnl/Trimastix_PCT/159.p2 GENE.gnl/Trimastix_PCT/159~~gnl/Trimastix_PCT/159.p2  ORF type:complete len:342 (-),score=138.49 gnl/Trimastix_PCT/159:195-1220(-)
MVFNIAINGFGRIGRIVFRLMRAQKDVFNIVAIHDLDKPAALAHLLKYDTVYRTFGEQIEVREDGMVVGGDFIPVLSDRRTPAQLPWREMNVDGVVECTGVFRTRATESKDGYDGHITAGARKVIICVPTKDECDATIVLGVNDECLSSEHRCISNASCTTNCLAPVARAINDAFGIVKGLMVTVHAVTNDQRVCDQIHADLRRARACGQNIIPTTTGAARACGKVIPSLKGKLDGYALRVPTITGSVVDLTFETRDPITKASINAAVKAASEEGPLAGILGYTEDPIVSSDVIGCPFSSLFDSGSTVTMGDKMAKIVAFYDNEYGYSCRVVDLMAKALRM